MLQPQPDQPAVGWGRAGRPAIGSGPAAPLTPASGAKTPLWATLGAVNGSGDGAVATLHDIALLISAENDLDRILAQVLAAAISLLGAASTSIVLGAPGAPRRCFASVGAGQPHWHERTDEADDG